MATNSTPINSIIIELNPWDLQLLQCTLSRTLDYFLPLAGRLGTTATSDGTTSFHIICSNTGAEFTHAVAGNVYISELLEPKYLPDAIYSLFPLKEVMNSDGVSMAVLPPLQQNELDKFVPPTVLRRFFHFSKQTVSELKAKANEEAGMDSISSLQAVSAYLWQGVTRARNRKKIKKGCNDQEGRDVSFAFHVAMVVQMVCKEAEILENGLGYAARKINDSVARQSRDTEIKFVQDWVKNPALVKKIAVPTFLVGSSPWHNVYGCDFGWGKPVAVGSGMGQNFDGKMIVYPTPEPGWVDVEVWLAPETLIAMDEDEEFMEPFMV
ncbi:uncharacterized acetyltransferase At3g50280-like [Andrographis paniculata]|uniref:uncharacterized acetyltransferase At3g50280-like n=1 Tax=Andrographis paniculata TaxID=175694 RepID=UPI0021E7B98D|nr:uncharacterized acetyltransferase At3g50280-like [Andrographis paniculata]